MAGNGRHSSSAFSCPFSVRAAICTPIELIWARSNFQPNLGSFRLIHFFFTAHFFHIFNFFSFIFSFFLYLGGIWNETHLVVSIGVSRDYPTIIYITIYNIYMRYISHDIQRSRPAGSVNWTVSRCKRVVQLHLLHSLNKHHLLFILLPLKGFLKPTFRTCCRHLFELHLLSVYFM